MSAEKLGALIGYVTVGVLAVVALWLTVLALLVVTRAVL